MDKPSDFKAKTDDISATLQKLENVDQDIDKLKELLDENPTLLGAGDVSELLRQLAGADDMAQGLESKLDDVLNNLDNLLDVLDNAPKTEAEKESSSSESKGEGA